MATKKKPTSEGPFEAICATCGHETSGPNAESVADAHERHVAKTGHRK